MKTIGIGLIGWGFMGRTHTHALRSIPLFYPNADFEIRLVCVCSRRIEKAKEAAEICGYERYTDDYKELLAMDDIDVVSVCTPNKDHEEMVIAALKAGKHVYVDKPLAVTKESADRIAAVAKESNVCTRMVFNNRYFPSAIRARELINEGRIGNILSFEARYLHSGSIDPNKPIGWKQQMQGGVILDLGIHALDLLLALTGYPKKVFCKTHRLYDARPTKSGEIETALSEDHAYMMLELPNGALGTVEASKIATGSNDELSIDVRGDKGAIKWNSTDADFVYFYDNTLPEAPYGGMRGFTAIESVGRYPAPGGTFLPSKNIVGWDRGHTHCYFTFLDDIAHDRTPDRGYLPDNGIDAGAKLQGLVDAFMRSDALGTWVDAQ